MGSAQTRAVSGAGQAIEDREALAGRYRAVRGTTEELCRPLATEDYVVQSMPDASPARWHLAHTTWFFETFVLAAARPGYRPFHPAYSYLFNSYYNAVGDRWQRAARGALSRPTVAEVYAYRRAVDGRVLDLLDELDEGALRSLSAVLVLGLHHEQQHQELLLTDIKHAFATNPLKPAYHDRTSKRGTDCQSVLPRSDPWQHPGGLCEIGQAGDGFAYDNETPRHRVLLRPFRLASRLVTCGEYQAFIDAGGYRRPDCWLSDGWDVVQQLGWEAPLYWEKRGGRWWHYTLAGMQPVSEDEPVLHVSYYEADAYARWADARLPTEAEWEAAASQQQVEGSFLDTGHLHPAGGTGLFGEAWQWTASAYLGYPGYRPAAGALGEYNGKFMCNQFVLRGGSCLTPRSHFRVSYRNFFPPETRWQFSGIRLAWDS
jgi:ergothioneine biosynthesis protein EgtB